MGFLKVTVLIGIPLGLGLGLGYFWGLRSGLLKETDAYCIGYDFGTRSGCSSKVGTLYVFLRRGSFADADATFAWSMIDSELLSYEVMSEDLKKRIAVARGEPLLHQILKQYGDRNERELLIAVIKLRRERGIHAPDAFTEENITRLTHDLGL